MVCNGAGNLCVQSSAVFYFTPIFKSLSTSVLLEDRVSAPWGSGRWVCAKAPQTTLKAWDWSTALGEWNSPLLKTSTTQALKRSCCSTSHRNCHASVYWPVDSVSFTHIWKYQTTPQVSSAGVSYSTEKRCGRALASQGSQVQSSSPPTMLWPSILYTRLATCSVRQPDTF